MEESKKPVLAWQPVSAIPEDQVPQNGPLSSLAALREEWLEFLRKLPESDRTSIKQRSLRRLAIETGILERLYDVDWGLTQTMVAEGFSREVIERAGGSVDDLTLATLQAQRDSLEMVLDFVRDNRALSVGFIRELHAAITRTQATYVARDVLGRTVELPLPHGEWKSQPNHVERADGSLLEYTPPEHVGSEMERLLDLYREAEDRQVHPIALAAWFHHKFVQIHPFADGNGRVGRALVLLVMQKHSYAPLVVDRHHRTDYIKALDAANEGDLGALIKLFVRLESNALANELATPVEEPERRLSSEIAHTLAEQIRAARARMVSERERKLKPAAVAIRGRLSQWFQDQAQALRNAFHEQGVRDVYIDTDCQMGEGAQRAFWFKKQTIEAAHVAGHFAAFGVDSGWCNLRLRLGNVTLRFLAAVHGAGQEAGVLAVVTFGELETRTYDDDEARTERQFIPTTKDAFRVVHTETLEQIEERLPELSELLEEGLAQALLSSFGHLVTIQSQETREAP